MPQPKWATPNRQAHLVRLFTEHGNKCLLGHRTCPIPAHYVSAEPKRYLVPIAETYACKDRESNPILDSQGNQAYSTRYSYLHTTVDKLRITRLYDLKCEQIIDIWKADDRAQRQAEAKAESKALHSLGERRLPVKGQFNGIGRDIFYASQPSHYIDGLGISGLTFKPFAKVRIASSYMRLFVDLGDAFKGVAKVKRRKAIRYGKALPVEAQRRIEQTVSEAVRHYLSNR